jgi:hypothetical protein
MWDSGRTKFYKDGVKSPLEGIILNNLPLKHSSSPALLLLQPTCRDAKQMFALLALLNAVMSMFSALLISIAPLVSLP